MIIRIIINNRGIAGFDLRLCRFEPRSPRSRAFMTINRYSVSPFSGANYRKNEKKLKDGETPCAICGKAVVWPFKHSVVVVDGGSDWAESEAEAQNEADPGYMGVWGIGPACHRKYLIKGEQ